MARAILTKTMFTMRDRIAEGATWHGPGLVDPDPVIKYLRAKA
jgi:hypothetical protein